MLRILKGSEEVARIDEVAERLWQSPGADYDTLALAVGVILAHVDPSSRVRLMRACFVEAERLGVELRTVNDDVLMPASFVEVGAD